MSEDLLKILIAWAPTFLFILSLLFYFVVGVIRGLRKSVIFLIHAGISIAICAGIFFAITNSKDIDVTMVSLVNYILSFFDMSVQGLLGVSEELKSVKDIILDILLSNMSSEEVFYYVIVDSGAYISTLVEMIYRIALFIVLFILHIFIMGFLKLTYVIFYPVRRRARRINKAYERGEADSPYQKKRLAGGLVNIGRGLIVNIFALSFLGCLLFVVTGENDPLPDRNAGTSDEISLGDDTFNAIYDYYSVVCEMSDTGIFKVLNSIQDSENVPYYFYICDLMLQGGIKDEILEVEDTFYLRRELGAYIGFCKDAIALFIEYAGTDINVLLNGGSQEEATRILTDIIKDPDFVRDFSILIDDFESQPFFTNLIYSALTSLVNHMDLVVGEDHAVTRLVRKVFNKETGIKVSEFIYEEDIKHLFKSIVNIASVALNDDALNLKAKQNFVNAAEEQAFDLKLIIKYANLLIDDIQEFSIFNDRSDVGNKLVKSVYEYCIEEFVEDGMDLPEVASTKWIDEINVLFDAVEPILNITVEIYSENADEIINNLVNMFNPENENAEYIEEQYDILVKQLSKSNVLDLVFKMLLPGETIDSLLQQITGNPEAVIPHNFTFASSPNKVGELEILLMSLKDFLKHDGYEIVELVQDGITGESLTRIFEILGADIDPREEVELKLIDEVLESKILRYVLSSFITYMDFGTFKLYIPTSASDVIDEIVTVTDEDGNKVQVQRSHNIIKREELSILTDFILSSPDFIIDLMEQSAEIDYVELLTSDEIIDLLKKSNLIQGLIASVVISVSESIDMIVLPYSYDDPETWIRNNEIDCLIDAILTLKDVETSSGESLFNAIMGGNIDINTILDLSQDVIDSIYKSNVLKYTVSDLLTNIGAEGFSIVVPGISCEKPNAKTTTDKTVNVISSEEILKIFDQIKNIIEFDDNNNVTILYGNLFDKKDEILSSYTIQATVMNLLISMTGGEGSFISVPKSYIDAYNSFVSTSSLEGLRHNKWFVSDPSLEIDDVTDDELYLLFEGIEKIIGKIDENFAFDNIADDLKINKETIDTVVSSAVLNSTVSQVLSSYVPIPLKSGNEYIYDDGIIVRKHLDLLFDCLFELLGKEELTMDDFNTLDISSIEITKEDINKVYKKSEIFMTALSSMIMDVENICLPITATKAVEIVPMGDKNIVYRILDESIVKPGEIDEFNNLIDCLFMFFGSTNSSGEEVLNINSVNVDDLKLDEAKIDKITSSTIFTATISNFVGGTEVIIPVNDGTENVAVHAEMANGTKVYILTNDELNSLLKTFLEMFGNDENGTKVLDINNINLDNFIIDQEMKNELLNSAVLKATISNYLIKTDGIVVPKMNGVTSEIQVVGSTNLHTTIAKEELENFIDAAIELFGKDNDGIAGNDELNINNVNTSNFIINDKNIITLGKSFIINATVTQELAKIEELVVPIINDNNEEIVLMLLSAKDNTSCAIIKDIQAFMNDMLDILGGEKREINPADLTSINIELVQGDDLDGILWATISKQLMDNENVLVPINAKTIQEVDVLALSNGEVITLSKELITTEQCNEFKDTLIEVLGEEKDGKKVFNLNLNSGVDITKMKITKEHITEGNDKYLFDSTIFTATVSKAVMGVGELTVPAVIKERIDFYNNPGVETIANEHTIDLFNALFITMNTDEININSFSMEKVKLPTAEENVNEEDKKINKMFKSLILSATVSNSVTSSAGSSIVILDQLLVPYTYNGKVDNSEKYIDIDELKHLILALSDGLGMNDASNLDISKVTIPTTDKKIKSLLGSTLIRATISKEVMNQQQDFSMAVEASSCEVDANGQLRYTVKNNRVVVLKSSEIEALIHGLIETGIANSSSFDNINLDLSVLVGSSSNMIKSVAESSILRFMVSEKALKKISYLGIEIYFYQLIGSSSKYAKDANGQTIKDENGNNFYEFSKNSLTFLYPFTLQNPFEKDAKVIYDSFQNPEVKTQHLFDVKDILVLQYMALFDNFNNI